MEWRASQCCLPGRNERLWSDMPALNRTMSARTRNFRIRTAEAVDPAGVTDRELAGNCTAAAIATHALTHRTAVARWSNEMRSFLIASLLIVLCASADGRTIQRAKGSMVHSRARAHVIVRPGQGPMSPARFSVPGWTDEQTEQWLDNATSCWACG